MNNISFQNNIRKGSPKIIKKYGNRKLYDTQQSSYVVLKDIEKMIKNKEEIQVIDNETKEDITIPTLTQIIFSLEKKSDSSVPLDILISIIREGDGSLSTFLSKLGLFTSNDKNPSEREKTNTFTQKLSHKKMNSYTSSIEQKITSLMNSNENLHGSNFDCSIPELPGNKSK
ncbi:MAG: polyhydroxyalkanoate synthesis regulator DNA-binding domain-containing protein [Bdellovibrionales bacterium]|nr:polyhydroxyalkanoate synthesis regulator DNA-binding domain-containing protein [Bdellovibrionales bacterium]